MLLAGYRRVKRSLEFYFRGDKITSPAGRVKTALSHLTVVLTPARYNLCLVLLKKLTVEGQISEQGGQQVHDEHGQEGHVGNTLHLSAGSAVWVGEKGLFSLTTRTE